MSHSTYSRTIAAVAVLVFATLCAACNPYGPLDMTDSAGNHITDLAGSSMKLAPLYSMVQTQGSGWQHLYATTPAASPWSADYTMGEQDLGPASDGSSSCGLDSNGNPVRVSPNAADAASTDVPDPAPCADGIAGYLFQDPSAANLPPGTTPTPSERDPVVGPSPDRLILNDSTHATMTLKPLYDLTDGAGDGLHRYATSTSLKSPQFDSSCVQTGTTDTFGLDATGGSATLIGFGFDPATSIPNVRGWKQLVSPTGDAYYAPDTSGITWAEANGYCMTNGGAPVIGLREAAPRLEQVVGLKKGNHHVYSSKSAEQASYVQNGWSLDGSAGYVWNEQVPGTEPIYWYQSSTDPNDNLYSMNTSESGYNKDGVLGYAYSGDQPETGTLVRAGDGSMSVGGAGTTVAHVMTSATPDIPYYEISNATGTAAGLQAGKGTPTMIVIHGGGFDAGWRTWDGAPTWLLDGPQTQQLVQRWNDRGWNTYAIEYPKGLDNGVVPVRWFAHQLRGILGSNTTVCATGYSAGGTLSYMLASNGPEGSHGTALDGAQVDCAISQSGPTNPDFLVNTGDANFATTSANTPLPYAANLSVPVLAAASNGELGYDGDMTSEVDPTTGQWAYAQAWSGGTGHNDSVVSTCVPSSVDTSTTSTTTTTTTTVAPQMPPGTFGTPPQLEMLCLDSAGGVKDPTPSGETPFVHDDVHLSSAQRDLTQPIALETYLAEEKLFSNEVLAHAG